MLKAKSSSILGPHEVFYTEIHGFDGASAPCQETVALCQRLSECVSEACHL